MQTNIVCIKISVQGWVLSSPKLVLDGQWTKPGLNRTKPGLNRTKLDKTGQNYFIVSVNT